MSVGQDPLGHQRRRAILRLLRAGEKSAGDIARELDQRPSSLSHHLAILHEQGLLVRRRAGARIYFSLETSLLSRTWNARIAGCECGEWRSDEGRA